jgi:hypothetical protein
MAIIIKPPVGGGGGGGGAVDSVNGATGVVVLTTDNIDAGSNADRQYFTTSIQSDIDSKADQSSLDTVQGKTLYSNSYYVNEGVNDIQTVVNTIAGGSGAYAIYMSAGSYSGSTLTISDAPSGMDIIAPYHPTSGHICELVSRGLTISGATTTRVRISDLNVEGALLIDGTLGRHYFKNCIFGSTVTITNATANFVTFEQCSFAGGISIASTVTATVYFDRCTMGNQLVTSLRAGAGAPLLTVLTECSGVNALQVNLASNVVLVGRTGFNDLSVVQYQNSDSYVYDLNNGLSTSFSGSYTELRNKPTIPSAYTDEQARDAAGTALANGAHTGISFVNNDGGDTINATVSLASFSTDNLAQGSTNKYFSDTLARGAFTAGTGISITTGTIASTITQYTDTLAKTASVVNSMTGTQTDQAPSVSSIKAYYTAGTGISLTGGTIASTITQYTDADADARITAQKGQANGICELDANSLVPTNHLPPLAITDVHVVADATERLALTVQEGDVAIQTDDSSAWIYSGTAWVQFSTGGAVLSVNGQTGTVSLDTDDVSEGATNKYFSDTLARGAFTAGTGISITTGTIASTITQYTDEQARDAVGTALANGSHTGISFVNNDGGDTIDATVSLASFSTDNLAQGSTNKYFSDTLARGAFTAGTGISITTGTIASTITQYTDTLAKTASVVNSMTGTQTDQAPSVSSIKAYYTAGTGISLTGGAIASTITQYTDELAQDASASLLTTGTHTGISYSYVDGSNKIDSTVSLAGFSIDALSDVDTSTTPPTSGQALAWDGTSKWIPTTIGGAGGGSRPSYTTVSSFPLTISAPASSVVKARYYLNNGTTAVTVNLPDVASCDGLEIVIKLLGTGTATIDASGSETIDGALTFALTLQNSSINLVATSAGWRIE